MARQAAEKARVSAEEEGQRARAAEAASVRAVAVAEANAIHLESEWGRRLSESEAQLRKLQHQVETTSRQPCTPSDPGDRRAKSATARPTPAPSVRREASSAAVSSTASDAGSSGSGKSAVVSDRGRRPPRAPVETALTPAADRGSQITSLRHAILPGRPTPTNSSSASASGVASAHASPAGKLGASQSPSLPSAWPQLHAPWRAGE